MIDETTVRGRIIAAAMRLAGERPWRQVTLAEIAGIKVSLRFVGPCRQLGQFLIVKG